jgi:outer membrane biosynthesis protein TonB
VVSAAGHAAVILVAVLLSGSTTQRPVPGGGDAITVEMVTLQTPAERSQQPEEIPEEAPEEQPEEVPEEAPEEQPEEVPEEAPEEQPEEVPEQQPQHEYSGVGSSGEATGQVPGPATYESRVFGAIRRHFRTSIRPERSYRIVFTVEPDGTTRWEAVRTSGTPAFDRAVEHALSMANVPPPPPGRTDPTEVRIEFLGPDSD